ncbi:hypothetical protein PDJAM_G00041030 [Pangasius djambal]|uniref:Uncharacterized protein n=1 Tax=Pangasius djambal TaxID=1691987 RepID=A0ACC5YTI4_9TELE|nr:hypothetical protein [Pangasius djambal]
MYREEAPDKSRDVLCAIIYVALDVKPLKLCGLFNKLLKRFSDGRSGKIKRCCFTESL